MRACCCYSHISWFSGHLYALWIMMLLNFFLFWQSVRIFLSASPLSSFPLRAFLQLPAWSTIDGAHSEVCHDMTHNEFTLTAWDSLHALRRRLLQERVTRCVMLCDGTGGTGVKSAFPVSVTSTQAEEESIKISSLQSYQGNSYAVYEVFIFIIKVWIEHCVWPSPASSTARHMSPELFTWHTVNVQNITSGGTRVTNTCCLCARCPLIWVGLEVNICRVACPRFSTACGWLSRSLLLLLLSVCTGFKDYCMARVC